MASLSIYLASSRREIPFTIHVTTHKLGNRLMIRRHAPRKIKGSNSSHSPFSSARSASNIITNINGTLVLHFKWAARKKSKNVQMWFGCWRLLDIKQVVWQRLLEKKTSNFWNTLINQHPFDRNAKFSRYCGRFVTRRTFNFDHSKPSKFPIPTSLEVTASTYLLTVRLISIKKQITSKRRNNTTSFCYSLSSLMTHFRPKKYFFSVYFFIFWLLALFPARQSS